MSLAMIVGLIAGFFYALVVRSISCGLVRSIISASIAERFGRHPMLSLEMPPVKLPARPSLLARIFSKVLLRQLSSDMGLKFLGSLVSIRPSFGMGTHLANFQAGGKVPCRRRLMNKFGRRSGAAR